MSAVRRVVVMLICVFAVVAAAAPLAMGAEPKKDDTLLSGSIQDIFEKGGWVMYIIVAGSVLGLALVFERLVALRRSVLTPPELMKSLKQAVESADLAETGRLVEGRNDPLSRIVREGLKHHALAPDDVERVMENAGAREVSRLKAPVRPIGILASVEPLLGLLGTITGMIGVFNRLQHTAVAERMSQLAPGVGEALYTTVGGLVAAIPFVIFYHYLTGRVNRAADEWSTIGTEFITTLCRRRAAVVS